jgi:hypothetical protein
LNVGAYRIEPKEIRATGRKNAEMIKSLSSFVPKERAMEKAFKAGAYWWQIGEHFGMSQQTAYETVKRAKKKRARK